MRLAEEGGAFLRVVAELMTQDRIRRLEGKLEESEKVPIARGVN